MRRLVLGCCIASACGAAEVSRVDDVNQALPLDSSLVAAWGFDETNGTTALDATGKGHTGALNGQARVAGKFGQALDFRSNHLTVADAPDLRLSTGMTIEAWVYPTGTLQQWPSVVVKERTGGLTYALYANSGPDTGGHPSSYITSGGVVEYGLEAGTRPAANVWTHLAVTYDGVTMRLYVGGVLAGNKLLNRTIDQVAGALRIGGNAVWSGEAFPGRLDEVRITTARCPRPRSWST